MGERRAARRCHRAGAGVCARSAGVALPLGRIVAARRAALPHKAPADLDKLERAVGDALTKVVWFDDRRIVSAPHRKVYGDRPGVALRIPRLTPELFDARAAAKPRTTRKSA
ncbi:MAG: RusA family crossover junction endodeoxyribonuclease [Planctomycetota bacterium]|nr:RusA family crossover junction endodeoxyribonuclease [Planctomycetota bacterium]